MRPRDPLSVMPEPLATALAGLPHWFVIGGQAVRCFCPYRPSRDVDLGVGDVASLDELLQLLGERGTVEVTDRGDDTVYLRFNGVNVSVFVLAPLVDFVEDRRLTVTGILATKLHAILDRDLLGSDGFREDLYYRIGVVTLRCPPLRERGADIRKLASTFVAPKKFTDGALEKLDAYPWPGNVRELSNVCERCAVLTPGDVVDVEALPLEVRIGRAEGMGRGEGGDPVPTLKEMEREMVVRALDATGGNRTKAAALLGITYPTLKKKIDAFGL